MQRILVRSQSLAPLAQLVAPKLVGFLENSLTRQTPMSQARRTLHTPLFKL